MKTQSPSGSRGRAEVRISNLPPWLSLLCMVIYIKEEPAMQISVSSTLTVYHDGQFNMRKPLSIGIIVRARFQPGFFVSRRESPRALHV